MSALSNQVVQLVNTLTKCLNRVSHSICSLNVIGKGKRACEGQLLPTGAPPTTHWKTTHLKNAHPLFRVDTSECSPFGIQI